MNPPELGKLPAADARRDAIHVAVAPVVAAHDLYPGQRVGLLESGQATPYRPTVGIVDPYLVDMVPQGATFWLCLLPGTVTSLRHEWTHPAFADPGAPQPVMDPRRWLMDFAASVSMHYDEMLDAANLHMDRGDYFHSTEDARDALLDDETRVQFWRCIRLVTGQSTESVEGHNPFSCSC